MSNSLIRGAQSLFGVKAQFKFGKTTVTGVFSEQNLKPNPLHHKEEEPFKNLIFFALDYDADKHYFYHNILETIMIKP